jgi:DNA polymerase III psi subunit
MDSQLTADREALRLFFTDDVYLLNEPELQVDKVAVVSAEPAIPVTLVQDNLIKKAREFKSLGNNKRQVLILVNDPQHEVSDEKGRELLRKIVKSVNLSAADFALVNYAAYQDASFVEFQQYFSSRLVFAFGVSPAQLALPACSSNTIVEVEGVRMIFSTELKALDQDAATKKALWGSLQKLGL